MIEIKDNTFRLFTQNYQYCFYVENGKLYHANYGENVGVFVNDCPKNSGPRYEEPTEYSEFGRHDFKVPSIIATTDKSMNTDFQFDGYEILNKKPSIGMPAMRGEMQTLAIYLKDARLQLKLTLFYTPYEEGLVRSVLLENEGQQPVVLHKISSGCFEFPAGKYDEINLCGRAMQERDYSRESVGSGVKRLRSEQGRTSHQTNCFTALLKEDTTEETGEAYGFNLIYSGNFNIETEKDAYDRVRVVVGENILYGGIGLSVGEKYYSPEVVSVYSAQGIGGMSRNFHRLYRKRLINPKFADKIRPIVINSWESIVFDVCEERLFEFIDGAQGLGIDMVVLDDGWFGKRDDDNCSLGDWYVDKNKLPNGLKPVIDRCHEKGMKFGLWFEPEMVNPDSDLYRMHPEWTMQTENTVGIQCRQQFVLDFSKKEVVGYIFESMKKMLEEYEIDYIKWDMNRSLTDVPNAKTYRDYVLGVYDLYERLTQAFPSVLIEGCSSGGARFDPGILYYSPMIWTSDNTDAWSRAKIQYSTSLCYPLQTMSNHVSKNKQLGRIIDFQTRANVAKFGTFGYELHIAKETEEHRELVKTQTAEYRKDADLILTGDLYRLKNPFTDKIFSQMVVSEDKSQAILLYMRGYSVYARQEEKIKLQGLENDATYLIEETGESFTGKQLQSVGLQVVVPRGDYVSNVYHLKKQ